MRKILFSSVVLLALTLSFKGYSQKKDWVPEFQFTVRDDLSYLNRSFTAFLSKGLYINDGATNDCATHYGEFRFRVNGLGEVDSMLVKGNLPPVFSNTIQKNIKSTVGRWKLPANSTVEDTCWFVFPFFVFIEYTSPSCDSSGRIAQSNFGLTYAVLLNLPYNEMGLMKHNGSYLIQPGSVGSPDRK